VKKFIVFAGLMLSSLVSPFARASIVVETASGTIGGIKMDNEGISGGTATILISRIPNHFSFINTVNGVSVAPDPVTVAGPITLLVTPTTPEHYDLALVPSTDSEAIGPAVGLQAILEFDMLKGVAPTSLPNFFNMSGDITDLLANANPVYDYSLFGPGGTINVTFTATTFSGGISSFAEFFTTSGSSVVGNGSFSEAAVPEPTSMIAMGVGMAGIMFYRRFRLGSIGGATHAGPSGV
jgi:hypothetical protein